MSATLCATLARTSAPQAALRRFLALDAVVTAGNGLAYALFAGPLGRLLGVDRPVLFVLGLALTGYGAGVGLLAARRRPPVPLVRCVIGANCAWPVLSLLAPLLWLSPTVAGAVWIPAQALVVAAFALLQWLALRPAGSGAQ
ncbi:hypothetical protein ACGFXC_00850 [Streptomyces sp. NPDC048507]|uniref:hypothetical protein n=1 Tax=Streptomyces sp. NPDC048507 TaxID=3365560 RepID=UPI00371441DC